MDKTCGDRTKEARELARGVLRNARERINRLRLEKAHTTGFSTNRKMRRARFSNRRSLGPYSRGVFLDRNRKEVSMEDAFYYFHPCKGLKVYGSAR